MLGRVIRRFTLPIFLVLALLGAGQSPSSAASIPTLASLRVVSQDWTSASLKVAWSWAKGHTYQVKYSHNADLSAAKYQNSTTDTGTWINQGIVPDKTLYVTARAVLTQDGAVSYGRWSTILKTSLKPYAVGSVGTVTPRPVDGGISLSFASVANASQYQVRWSAGPNPNRTPDKWPNRWVSWSSAFGQRTPSLTVQGSDDNLTRPEYGNPIFAEVQARNTYYGSTVKKARQVVGWPKPVAPDTSGHLVRFGAYNVMCSQSCDGGRTKWWSGRGDAVADNIEARDLDIVAVSEAAGSADPNSYKAVFKDLDTRLEGMALTHPNDYKNGQSEGNRIYYDPAKYAAEASGLLPGVRHYGKGLSSTQDQNVPWTRFRSLADGTRFIVVSAHFENPATSNTTTKKTYLGRNADQLMTALDRVNTGGLPVILGGDLNDQRYPEGRTDGPQAKLVRDGDFYDASASVKRVGTTFPTYNNYQSPASQDEDANGNGLRIDYILTQGFRGSGEFQNVWNPGTSIIPSDHNLIRANLYVPWS
jgi:hypothetical protein